MSDANTNPDVVIFGASGFTGRLVAEYFAAQHPDVSWGMAGRNLSRLEQVRSSLGPAAAEVPLIEADASHRDSLNAMAAKTGCVLTTAGPYQLYGSELLAACAEAGTDYVDLTGEPGWMHAMIAAHEDAARRTGARIVFSCGFDSIPFDLGVQFLQQAAGERGLGPLPRIRCRVQAMNGGFSGGTAASLSATMEALKTDPQLLAVLTNPFALAGGFQGPQQPDDSRPMEDELLGVWVAPFIMAPINTKNVHRSNALLGHPYGEDFRYDEMMVAGTGDEGRQAAEFLTSFNPIGENAPRPGEGPSKEERDNGSYDLLFIGETASGEQLRARVTGDRDPGYGSTSRMIAESALCLTSECSDLPGGIYTPASAMGQKLIRRLTTPAAGLSFEILS